MHMTLTPTERTRLRRPPARGSFETSMNYRSVVVLGKARTVTADCEKVEALRCFTDHIVPDDRVRPEVPERVVIARTLAGVAGRARGEESSD